MQQATKPAPPARRTSVVLSGNYNPLSNNTNEDKEGPCDETENLPPPPAFLLEGSNNPSPTPQRYLFIFLFINKLILLNI